MSASKKQKKVLIIDTDQFIIRTLTSKLEAKNLGVETADQTWVAIEKLKKNKYDLIILEIVIPLFSWYEILKYLKKSEKNQKTPVIVLTNLQQNEDITNTLEYEITDYIIKINVDLNELTEKVKTILENQQKNLSKAEKEGLATRLMTISQQNNSAGTPKNQILKCSKCEATLPPKTEFCPYCGTKVETDKIIQQNY